MAAIVSAYKDGREVVSKIRERRRLQRASPPTRLLDESLVDAARDIESEKSRGISRLGPSFDRGDDVAVIQLRQIRIELEAQLFRQLAQALRDDAIVDFRPAVEASDLGRDHTLTAMIQLRQRLMVTAPIEIALQDPILQRSPALPLPSIESRPLPLARNDRQPTLPYTYTLPSPDRPTTEDQITRQDNRRDSRVARRRESTSSTDFTPQNLIN